jgi:hypothetical protein
MASKRAHGRSQRGGFRTSFMNEALMTAHCALSSLSVMLCLCSSFLQCLWLCSYVLNFSVSLVARNQQKTSEGRSTQLHPHLSSFFRTKMSIGCSEASFKQQDHHPLSCYLRNKIPLMTKKTRNLALVAHTCNRSYPGGWDLEDRGLTPVQAESLQDPISTGASNGKKLNIGGSQSRPAWAKNETPSPE